ncbi:MAG: hypothetical protein SV760_05405, partial [Halobacteria archaeon]|nr:hypothetical protein [Halobacteria archaeon]
DPVIEVGREDSPLGTGRRAVIRPCPLCGEEHTHKFGEDLEEGKLVRKASECPETELYWLVWFGEGEGKWHDDDRCEDEPRME